MKNQNSNNGPDSQEPAEKTKKHVSLVGDKENRKAVQGELADLNVDCKEEKPAVRKRTKPKQKNEATGLFLLIHQTNLLEFVSGGLVIPWGQMNEPARDSSSLCSDRLVLWSGQVPKNVVAEFFGDRIGNIPIAVELDSAGLTGKNIPAFDEGMERVEVNLPKHGKNIRSIFIGGVIPAGAIVALHFENKTDLGEFVVRQFDNVKTDDALCRVTPELFQGAEVDLKAFGDGISGMAPCKPMRKEGLIRHHDKILGAITMLCACTPQKSSWLDLINLTLDFYPARTRKKGKQTHELAWLADMIHDREVPVGKIDQGVFVAAAGILRKSNPMLGYKNGELISDIMSVVCKNFSDEDDRAKTVEWEKYMNDVLMGMKRVSELSDDRSIGLSSLLYFLILGTPADIYDETNPSVKAGPKVRLFAGILAGLYHGRSRMSLALKGVVLSEESLMAISSDALNRLMEKPLKVAGVGNLVRKIETHEESDSPELDAELTVGGRRFLKISDMPPHSMMSLYYDAKDAGFDLKYHFDRESFSYTHEYGDGRSQEIFIEVLPEREGHGKTFRFLSRCLDLGRTPKKFLPYEKIYNLLLRNCEKTMHCRFGIDGGTNTLVVLSDQQMETMDRSEFELKFHYVAKVADEFEKGMGLDKY